MQRFSSLAAVALVLGLSASRASAEQLITLSVEGSTSSSGPFSNSLAVNANTTYYYEVVATISPVGTTDGTHTITSRSASPANGNNSLSFTLNDIGSAPVPVSISSGILQNGYGNGTGAQGGTSSGTSLDTVRAIQSPGVFVGVPTVNTPEPVVVMTGTFTTGATVAAGTSSVIDGSFAGATSSIKINGTGVVIISSSTESSSNPIVGYDGLTLTAPAPSSVPEPSTPRAGPGPRRRRLDGAASPQEGLGLTPDFLAVTESLADPVSVSL